MKINRRKFVRRASVLSGSVFLQNLLPHLVNQAYGFNLQQKHFFLYLTGNGLHTTAMRQTEYRSERDFKLPEYFSPLHAYQEKLLVVEGFYNSCHDDMHGSNMCGLTCARDLKVHDDYQGLSPKSASFDFALAQNLPNVTANIPVLALGTPEGNSVKERLASGPERIEQCEPDPMRAFESTFAGMVGQNNTPDMEAAQKRLSEERSILDLLRADIKSAQNFLGKAESNKLTEYLESIRLYEKSLGGQAKINQEAARICQDPAKIEAVLRAISPNDGFQERMERHLALGVQAVKCGLAQNVSFVFSPGGQHQDYPFLGASGHHNLCHDSVDKNDQGAENAIMRINNYHASNVVSLAKQLEEADLLDRSLIYWYSDVGGKHHWGQDYQSAFLLGDCQGYLDTGKYIRLDKKHAHPDVYITMANAMGWKTNTFGDGTDPTTGEISAMKKGG